MSCNHRCIMVCHAGPCSDREQCKKKVTIRCPCKRQKKEVQCLSLLKNATELICNDECVKLQETLKAEKLESDLKLEEEEKRKQELELQDFLRKTEGKKRKKKKILSENGNNSKFSVNYTILAVAILCLFILVVFYLLKSE